MVAGYSPTFSFERLDLPRILMSMPRFITLHCLCLTTHRPSTPVNAFCRVETGGISQAWMWWAIDVDAMRDGLIDALSCLAVLRARMSPTPSVQ
jgi:hypothetical protein